MAHNVHQYIEALRRLYREHKAGVSDHAIQKAAGDLLDRMMNETRHDPTPRQFDDVLKLREYTPLFMERNPEVAPIMVAKIMIQVYRLPLDITTMPAFDRFTERYGKYIRR